MRCSTLLYSLILILGLSLPSWGQQKTETDSISVTQSAPSLTLPKNDSLQIEQSKWLTDSLSWKPQSKKALLWALLPGGGQVYNRKYWKLPIVWGALATCGYFINFNARLYKEYHEAYRDIMSADPASNTAWLPLLLVGLRPKTSLSTLHSALPLQRGNDYYRRYRDLSIVLAIGIYGLSILDAYVDAELFTFDISPDLSMRVAPTLIPTNPMTGNMYQVGMGCQLTF